MTIPRWTRPELAARAQAEAELSARMAAVLGTPVRVALTRNRKRLISVRSGRSGRVLRLHSALADASNEELAVLAAWVEGRSGSQEAVRTLLARHAETIDTISALRAKPPRPSAVVGRHHDLLGILHELRAAYFPEMGTTYIAWSGRLERARRRRLGSWSPRSRLIRIHLRLDAPDVPQFFVASVVHHELCHAACEPSRTPTGRRRVHGPEFRALEERFPDLERSREWERDNLQHLLGP